eukprot:GILJ01002894.1.p1 GENE.GILJ01002894.1~~GILJ01002894.1.p1  ORF type:complete len:494 (+),score=74.03 GILJ01002894.1:201-1682(+)
MHTLLRSRLAYATQSAIQTQLAARSRRVFSSQPSVCQVDDPYTGQIIAEAPLLSREQAERTLEKSKLAQGFWKQLPLDERIGICEKAIQYFHLKADKVATEITQQMGKPLSQSRNEIKGMDARARTLFELAPQALAEEQLPKEGFSRKITREPVGVVMVLSPWNYPLLTTVNALLPALLAGNSVVLKHSFRTPLCANQWVDAFAAAGAPEGLVSYFNMSHDLSGEMIQRPEIGFVAFTGSVGGGHSVHKLVANRFIDCGLELGGCDPGYVCEDANVASAAENLVDGAMYNAGQSCCGIQRVYVHKNHYEEFVQRALTVLDTYVLGDPKDAKTSMGPVAQPETLDFLTEQVNNARELGGRVLCGGVATSDANGKGRFFKPTLVADATHNMSMMRKELFGPTMSVTPVESDAEAIELMNDSAFGLTASLWTKEEGRATSIAQQLECGTVFMNRCDYLDPEMPWCGVKDTGKGVTLSKHGFAPFTRFKSYHFKLAN